MFRINIIRDIYVLSSAIYTPGRRKEDTRELSSYQVMLSPRKMHSRKNERYIITRRFRERKVSYVILQFTTVKRACLSIRSFFLSPFVRSKQISAVLEEMSFLFPPSVLLLFADKFPSVSEGTRGGVTNAFLMHKQKIVRTYII